MAFLREEYLFCLIFIAIAGLILIVIFSFLNLYSSLSHGIVPLPSSLVA